MKNICKEIKSKIFEYLEGKLKDKEAISIKNHIKNCSDCQKELEIGENILCDLWEIKTFSNPKKILDNLHKTIKSQESEEILHISTDSVDDFLKKIDEHFTKDREQILEKIVEITIPLNNKSKAIAVLQEKFKEVGIVLVDLSMPSGEGWEVLKQLKATGAKNIICITSMDEDKEKRGYTQFKIYAPAGNKF